jgi:hypothetical protein
VDGDLDVEAMSGKEILANIHANNTEMVETEADVEADIDADLDQGEELEEDDTYLEIDEDNDLENPRED